LDILNFKAYKDSNLLAKYFLSLSGGTLYVQEVLYALN